MRKIVLFSALTMVTIAANAATLVLHYPLPATIGQQGTSSCPTTHNNIVFIPSSTNPNYSQLCATSVNLQAILPDVLANDVNNAGLVWSTGSQSEYDAAYQTLNSSAPVAVSATTVQFDNTANVAFNYAINNSVPVKVTRLINNNLTTFTLTNCELDPTQIPNGPLTNHDVICHFVS